VLAATAACRGGDGDATAPDPAPAPPDAAAAAAVPTPVSSASPPAATPGEREEHAVFSLGDNRLLAHRVVDGDLVVDAGSAGFARYTRFGLPHPRWRLVQRRDGVRVAVADALASLDLPLTDAQAAAAALTMRLWAPEPRRLTVKVNGRKAGGPGSIDLAAGWQTVTVAVAAGRWHPGENQVVLETGGRRTRGVRDHRLALAWLRVGAAPGPAAVAGAADPRGAAVYDPAFRRFYLREGAGLVWYVMVPDGAHLLARVAGDARRVAVGARAGDGTFAGGLLGGDGTRVDLSAVSGRVVRLELTARDCPLAIVAAARITVPGPAPRVAPPGAPPRYVVLWIMDALRAQAVRPFTPGARALVPNFEALARTGVVFRQFSQQGNESQTSHSTMWTSTYPAVHDVRTAGNGGTWKIRRRFAVIGQLLHAAGFRTLAVTGNGFITRDGGYTRGFDDFRNMMREKGIINGVLHGDKVVAAALGKLARAKDGDQPVFLFIGTVDTHGPWIARHPWIEKYDPGPYHGPFRAYGTAAGLGLERGKMGCSKIPARRDLQRLRAIYDSAVSYQDARLGDFVAQLKTWGIYDQTLLLVTADHGEEMFEHGRCGHGGSLAETLTRVPLLVHYPARFPGGVAVDEGAEGIDLVPTILDAIGAAPPAQAQGQSLRPLAFGVGRGWVRPSFTAQYQYAFAMQLGPWKAIVGRSGTPIVYDEVHDPGEQTNVAATHPVERRFLTDALGLFLSARTRWHKDAWGVVTNMMPRAALDLDRP
jgi:arylsulfatase A-like enzyme